MERCWGIVEVHWHGAQLRDTDTRLAWAHSRTWKGLKPVVDLRRKVYAKGVTVRKTAMQAVATRWERNPLLPKWDMLIHPAGTT